MLIFFCASNLIERVRAILSNARFIKRAEFDRTVNGCHKVNRKTRLKPSNLTFKPENSYR